MLSRPGFGRLGCGGSPGTAGVAQDAAPAQFALTASKAPPAWRCAQHRSREGEQDGGGRAHSARGRGNRAGGTSRGQHQPAKQVLSSSQPGVPRQSTGKPPFQIPTLPAPPPPVLDKGGTVSHQHRDHQLLVGTALRSLQKQSAYLVQPPKRGIFPRGTNSLLVRVAQRDPQAPAAPPHWQMAEKQMAHRTAQEGTQEPSGRYFLASVSPATLGKAPCHWSRPGVRAPPLLGGLCPGQPSSSSPSLPPGSHGPRGRRASPGSRWQNPGPTRPRPRPGPGLSQPSPRREPRSA